MNQKKPKGCVSGCVTVFLLAFIGFLGVFMYGVSNNGLIRNNADANDRQESQKAANGNARVEILGVELKPIRVRGSQDVFRKALFRFRNNGPAEVRAVEAEIRAFNKDGTQIFYADSYTVFSIPNSEAGMAPGRRWRTPPNEGFLIPVSPAIDIPVKVTATVVRVSDDGGGVAN